MLGFLDYIPTFYPLTRVTKGFIYTLMLSSCAAHGTSEGSQMPPTFAPLCVP